MWAIFLSLGFFTVWALMSWAVSVAPLLELLEGRSASGALVQKPESSGKIFTGKLVEISMVMGIVNLALIVLAMVFSAAPLPFIDQLGAGAMHVVWVWRGRVLPGRKRLLSGGAHEELCGVLAGTYGVRAGSASALADAMIVVRPGI